MFNRPLPIPPQAGQESVWDYPRPPRLENCPKLIEITFNNVAIAKTNQAKRVLETSHPPVYYIPPTDIAMTYLTLGIGSSFCEWKGIAVYYTISVNGQILKNVGWSYPQPTAAFADIKDYIAFYPQSLNCTIDSEPVQPQPGGFYGGWITHDIVGPFKGGAGTMGW